MADREPGIRQDAQPAGDSVTTVRRWIWEWTKSIVIAFGLFLVIRTFLVEAFRIPTGSMENTLLVGDFLLVNKAVFGSHIPFTSLRTFAFSEPRRGDIVVFVPPHEPGKNYVKRLVAGPGDVVEMREKVLFLNGAAVDEPYVRYTDDADVYSASMYWQCEYTPHAAGDNGGCRPYRDNWGPLVVPPDRYLMLGDNRDDSEDSRYWGFVDRSAIKGKPLVIYYSFEPDPNRPVPWLSNIRWSRLGRVLR
jgi:signal peptidase I